MGYRSEIDWLQWWVYKSIVSYYPASPTPETTPQAYCPRWVAGEDWKWGNWLSASNYSVQDISEGFIFPIQLLSYYEDLSKI